MRLYLPCRPSRQTLPLQNLRPTVPGSLLFADATIAIPKINHMRNLSLCLASMFLISAAFGQNVKSCKPCEQLKNLQLPDVTILVAEAKVSDTIKNPEPWIPTVIIHKPFCRVLGRISKELNFDILLPDEGNGMFLMF